MADFSDFADMMSCSINNGGGCAVGVAWEKNSGCEVYVRNQAPFGVDTPIQHGGRGIKPCPHELLLSAAGSCFIGTFQVFQSQLRVEIVDIRTFVTGCLELGTKGENEGKYDLSGIDLFVKVKVKGEDEFDKEIVGDILRMTKNHCPTTRALAKACPINIISEIEMTPE